MCTQRPLWTFSLLKFCEDCNESSHVQGERNFFFVRGVQGLSWGGSEPGM
jgi:hypothetical protein